MKLARTVDKPAAHRCRLAKCWCLHAPSAERAGRRAVAQALPLCVLFSVLFSPQDQNKFRQIYQYAYLFSRCAQVHVAGVTVTFCGDL